MPIHLGGFLEDIDPAGAFANLTALADQRLFTQNDDIRVPELNRIIMAACGTDNVAVARARLTSPTLDATVRPEIMPHNQAAGDVEPGSPPALMKMLRNPLVLGVDEILRGEINSNPAAVADQWILLWFSDGPVVPVDGQEIITVRGTSATAQTARAWTQCNITLDEELPPGRYQVVGLHASAASCIAARVMFRTGDLWRPGCLGVDDEADLSDEVFRNGNLGVWGEFPFTQLPAVEFLSDLADAAQIVHFDLIKVG